MKLIIDTENAEHIILHDKDIIQIHELFIGKKDLAKPNISYKKLKRYIRMFNKITAEIYDFKANPNTILAHFNHCL
jgi:hypothetical protein